MLRDKVRIHLDVREFAGMPLEVNLEVALGGEAVAADIALVRPLTRVTPDVNLQRRVRAEHLTAVATPVLEKRFSLLFVLFLANTEVSQVVGQEALTSIVKDALCSLLQKFQ